MFSKLYEADHKTISLEFFPPRKVSQLEETLKMISDLALLQPDFMTCTYGAGGGTRALTRQIVSYMHNQLKLPAVAHLTCVGHSQAEIDGVLDGLAAEGIFNILALRGDPPKGIQEFIPPPQGFSCARDLVSHVARRKEFAIAVAGYPEKHRESTSWESEIAYLRAKQNAGGEVVLTQLFFDEDLYFDFLERARAGGVIIPIVPGVMPISSVGQLEKFGSMFNVTVPEKLKREARSLAGAEEELIQFGISAAISLCEKLVKGGAPGVHLYTLNRSTQARPIVEKLRTLI